MSNSRNKENVKKVVYCIQQATTQNVNSVLFQEKIGQLCNEMERKPVLSKYLHRIRNMSKRLYIWYIYNHLYAIIVH